LKALKAEKTAQRADAGGLPGFDQNLPSPINFVDAILPLPKFQAAHLASRFGLAPHLATIVASLAWEARQ
jgi:hypothetical protein